MGRIEHVVQHAGRDVDYSAEGFVVKACRLRKWIADEDGQIDGAEAAAAIRRQRLFGTRVGGFYGFAVVKVVVFIHAVKEQNTWLGVIVGRAHDLLPQIPGAYFSIYPKAVFALVGTCGADVI